MEEATQPPVFDTQAPMDEFEASNGKLGNVPKNSLKLVKLGGIALVLLLVLGGGAIVALKMFSNNNPTVVQATPIPQSTPFMTTNPLASLPPEYADLDNKIQQYNTALTDTPESRSRLNYPPMTFESSY
jgi:hypothetical protein